MLNLFKKKDEKLCLYSPVKGELVSIESVNDPVFAGKMMGEGVGVIPTDTMICAPADGTISLISDTKHAFGMMLNNDEEILVHIGIDTVNLAGKGFEVLVNVNDKVKKGTPIIKADFDYLKSQGIDTTTMLIFLNHANYNNIQTYKAKEADTNTIALEYTK